MKKSISMLMVLAFAIPALAATKVKIITYDDANEAAIVAAGATLLDDGIAIGDTRYTSGISMDGINYYPTGIYDGWAGYEKGIFDGTTQSVRGIFDGTTYYQTGIFDGNINGGCLPSGIFDGTTHYNNGIYDGITYYDTTGLTVDEVKSGETWQDGDGPHEGELVSGGGSTLPGFGGGFFR